MQWVIGWHLVFYYFSIKISFSQTIKLQPRFNVWDGSIWGRWKLWMKHNISLLYNNLRHYLRMFWNAKKLYWSDNNVSPFKVYHNFSIYNNFKFSYKIYVYRKNHVLARKMYTCDFRYIFFRTWIFFGTWSLQSCVLISINPSELDQLLYIVIVYYILFIKIGLLG